MERDNQNGTQHAHHRVERSIILPRTSTIIFVAPNPEIEVEDVIINLLRPLHEGEWRFVFIPRNLLEDVMRELRNYLALEALHEELANLILNA